MTWFIVGLGNPGSRYERTRHNAGFLVADRLCERGNFSCDREMFGCLTGAGELDGHKVVVAKPQQYMNKSGHPARSVMGFYKINPRSVLVVHDELDLPFGTLRLKVGGGHGGHNGLRDLHEHLGGGDYARLRFGIGRPPEGWQGADYVLSRWTTAEQDTLTSLVDAAVDMLRAVFAGGVAAAMNAHNTRKKPQPSAAPTPSEQPPLSTPSTPSR